MGPIQLMLCLLSTGLVKSSVLQLRRFEYVTEQNRIDAYNTCQSKNMSLVTLYDEEDAKFVQNFNSISDPNSMPTVWVGLQKISNNSEDIPKCPSTCGMVNCSEKLSFKCNRSSDIRSNEDKLNWCKAKQYCQYHALGDLATNESSANTTDSLWISGKITDNWKWDDGGCSTYREWNNQPNEENATTVGRDRKLKPQIDMQRFPAVCSTGDLRIVVVNQQKTWEQALEYCDTHHSGLLQIPTKEHQESVEQWFNVTGHEGTGHEGTFWVGLRQSQVFGFWIWKDTMVGTSNWEKGRHPMLPLSQECGVIQAPGYKWRDYNCLHPLPFICQENIVWLNT